MSRIDTNEEWRRLRENYSAMTDEELAQIAQDAYELTDIAKQALQEEISRRHLDIRLRQQAPSAELEEEKPPEGYPPGFNPEDWGLINFSSVATLEDARAMKKCLDDAGIPSYYGPDVVDDLRLLPTTFPALLRVKVRQTDKDHANYALSRCRPTAQEEPQEEIPEYTAHCPKCHSTDIVLEGVDDAVPETDAGSKYNWSCDACGHRWHDEGIESET